MKYSRKNKEVQRASLSFYVSNQDMKLHYYLNQQNLLVGKSWICISLPFADPQLEHAVTRVTSTSTYI